MLLNEQTAVQLGDKKVVGVRQGDKFILGRHNLVPNGRAKYTSGTVEVRRNLHINPGARTTNTDFSGWCGTHNTVTKSVVQASWSSSGTASRYKFTDVQTNDGDIDARFTSGVTAGKTYTIVLRYVASRSGIEISYPRVTTNNTNTGVSPTSSSRNSSVYKITLTAGVVYTDWITIVAPSMDTEPTGLRMILPISSHQTGDYIDRSMADIYEGEYQENREWFDGSYSPDPDLTPSWTGAENNSPSVLSGAVPTGFVQDIYGRAYVSHDSAGNAALTTLKTRIDGNVYSPIGAVTEGQWVGVSGWIYNADNATSVAQSFGIVQRGVAPWETIAPALITDADMRTTTNGFKYVSGAVQVTSSATSARVHLGAFSVPIGARFMVRDMMVSVADTQEEALRLVQVPYRDGDSPGWTWDGTPGNSASRGLS